MIEKIWNHIEKSVPTIVELETELTRHPAMSPDSGGEGEWDKCEALEAWLRKRGITELERHDASDPRAKNGKRPNLVATIRGASDAKRLWLMSHTDVVPPGELSMWKSDP